MADHAGRHVAAAVSGFEIVTAIEVFEHIRGFPGKVRGFTADVTVLARIDRDAIEVTESVAVCAKCSWIGAVVNMAGPADLIGVTYSAVWITYLSVVLDVLVE
ncbi:MAG: hypothetical protein SCH70_14575 [Candidatus Methanoperedens sp.]|nr:hypothetical protein [Candidatus Methanoperedens sp.]